MLIELRKPGREAVAYRGRVLRAGGGHVLVHAVWERPRTELGYAVFEPGDHFFEHFWADRWYTVFEVRRPDGLLKGWYCNVARPAELRPGKIVSVDLALDLFVPPDRAGIVTLDEDEFAALRLDETDAEAHGAALAALAELRRLVAEALPPFGGTDAFLSLGTPPR